MSTAKRFLLLFAASLTTGWWLAPAQQGPRKESSETVARPRKKDASGEKVEAELPKIPSQMKKKGGQELPEGLPTFRSDNITVGVEVAVLDNRGRFIPKIPQQAFRILEDGVPQKIAPLLIWAKRR